VAMPLCAHCAVPGCLLVPSVRQHSSLGGMAHGCVQRSGSHVGCSLCDGPALCRPRIDEACGRAHWPGVSRVPRPPAWHDGGLSTFECGAVCVSANPQRHPSAATMTWPLAMTVRDAVEHEESGRERRKDHEVPRVSDDSSGSLDHWGFPFSAPGGPAALDLLLCALPMSRRQWLFVGHGLW